MIHVNANPESAADFQTEILKPNLNELKSIADHWLLACLYDFTEAADTYLDKAQFHLYAECVRKFFYQQLCDTFIVSLQELRIHILHNFT
jgi:valyl-tRNA synthetase